MILRKNVTLMSVIFFLFICFIFNWNILVKFEFFNNSKHNEIKFIKKIKFVSFECHLDSCGGLADRFKGIMNAYAWSIFTNRKLIINISQPCNFENLIIPNKVDWNLNLKDNKNIKFLKSLKNKTTFELKKMLDFKFREDLLNIDILNYQSETDIIKIYTNLEWFSSYSKNRYLIEAGKMNYKENSNISIAINKWFNNLFKLNPRIQLLFNGYLKKVKPRESSQLICAQIRIGGKRPYVNGEMSFAPRNFSKFYWEYIKKTFLKGVNEFKLFITSDTKSVEIEALKAFGKENVTVIEGFSTHMDVERNMGNDCSRYDKIVMDFFMLGYCDKAIVSNSGFGIFGVLRNKYPINNNNFVVFNVKKDQNHNFSKLFDFIHANPNRF